MVCIDCRRPLGDCDPTVPQPTYESLQQDHYYNARPTGYTGIYFDLIRKKYRAMMSVNGKSRQLGYYSTVEEALHVRNTIAKSLGFYDRVQETKAVPLSK